MTTVRLLSYNVRSMRDDRAALGRVIRSAEPDVVCIQEAPRFARWRSLAAELARRSGLVVVDGGRPAAAQLLLSTLAVDVVETRCVRFTKDPKLHQRGAVMARLRLAGAEFAVVGTHLDVVAEPRLRHVGELHTAVSDWVPPEVPAVIAGDMNCHPGSPPWNALAEQRADAFATAGTGTAWTSTAVRPHQTIDGIFVDSRITVQECRVIEGVDTIIASDHRPLLAVLEID